MGKEFLPSVKQSANKQLILDWLAPLYHNASSTKATTQDNAGLLQAIVSVSIQALTKQSLNL